MKTIKETVFNYFDKSFEEKLRKRLKTQRFSLFTSNCMAGVIYHRLGVQFQSPTINYFMADNYFLKFVMNLDYYLNQELLENGTDGNHPLGMLGDIPLQFTHYSSYKEGYDAWNRRKERIDFCRLYFVLFDTVDGVISEQDIVRFGKIKCANKIVLSKNHYPQYDYVLTIPINPKDTNKHYMARNLIGRRRFEKNFDYVDWINKGCEFS